MQYYWKYFLPNLCKARRTIHHCWSWAGTSFLSKWRGVTQPLGSSWYAWALEPAVVKNKEARAPVREQCALLRCFCLVMNIVNHSRRPPRLLYYIVANSGVKRSALDPCDAASLDFGTQAGWNALKPDCGETHCCETNDTTQKTSFSRLHHAKSKQYDCEQPASVSTFCCAISCCFYKRGCVPLNRTELVWKTTVSIEGGFADLVCWWITRIARISCERAFLPFLGMFATQRFASECRLQNPLNFFS